MYHILHDTIEAPIILPYILVTGHGNLPQTISATFAREIATNLALLAFLKFRKSCTSCRGSTVFCMTVSQTTFQNHTRVRIQGRSPVDTIINNVKSAKGELRGMVNVREIYKIAE